MKAALITTLFLLLTAGLAGCGQKGPLYQDEQENTAAHSQTTADSKAGRASPLTE